MKKIGIIIVLLLLLVGCGKKSASDEVIFFLEQYKKMNVSVINSLENDLAKEEWFDEQKERYRNVIKRQYKDMEYEIVHERYDSDLAFIDVKIKVYDYYKAQENIDYYNIDNGMSLLDYKINAMANTNDRIEYPIVFKLEKDTKGDYKIIDLDNSDIEKIHGIYNYNM